MAYTPDFDFDIFISYAHVDNCKAKNCQKGWIDFFHDELQTYLNSKIGRQDIIKIWRDKSIEGNYIFDQTIKEKISGSALFIAFVSNGYLKSEYCLKELKMFHSNANNQSTGLIVEDKSRIFPLLLTNIQHAKYPDQIKGMTGFEFHDAESTDDIGDPTEQTEKLYRDQFKKLAKAVFRCLIAIENNLKPEELTQTRKQSNISDFPEPDKNYPVFIADVTDTLSNSKKRIINDLKSNGIYVMKNIPPPYEPVEKHDQEIIQTAEKSCLTVHMFDIFQGRDIPDEPDNLTYCMKQLNLCLEKSASKLIWHHNSLDLEKVEDEFYQNFLKNLENLPCPKKNIEFIKGNKEDIITGIFNKIKKLKQAQQTKLKSENETAVLLDTHIKDCQYHSEIQHFLMNKNITHYINTTDDNPQANLEHFEKCLKDVSALLFVYGNVVKEWVISRLFTAMNIINEKQYKKKIHAIYLAPPNKEKEITYLKNMIPNVKFINNSDQANIKPEIFEPFFECIGCGGAI